LPKSLDTLVDDIYAVLDEDNDHEASEENIQWAGETLKELLRVRLAERKTPRLRFSNIGKPDRQLWYTLKHHDKREKLLPKHIFKFLYGDVIELLMLFLAKEAGHSVERAQEEIEVDGIKGHIDAVIDDVVVDAKSASSFAFKKFTDGRFLTDDPFGYIPQLSGYANALDNTESGAAFLVADKVHGDIAIARVAPELVAANKPSERIQHVKEVLASDQEPPKCYSDVPEGKSGNRKLNVNCSYCPFKFHCWRDSNNGRGLEVYSYSTGPVFLTHVAKEPRVERITPF